MNGWLIFLILLAAYVALVYYAKRRGTGLKGGFELNGPFLMWRTQFGKPFLERVSRARKFWNVIADFGILLTWAMGALIFVFLAYLFVIQVQGFFTQPERAAAAATAPQYLVGLPGINPIIPIGYGLVAIVLALVIHEGSHGVMAYAARMKVKSLGLLFFIIPIGAFVEPDEEDLERSTTREKNRVFAAGPTSNIILAVAAGLVLSSMMGSLALANEGRGVIVATVEPDSAASEAGLRPADLITAFDFAPVASRDDYLEVINHTWANQSVRIDYLRDGTPLSTNAILKDRAEYLRRAAPGLPQSDYDNASGKGFLGIQGLDGQGLDSVRSSLENPFQSGRDFLIYNLYPLIIFTEGIDILAEPYNQFFVIEGTWGSLPPVLFFALASIAYWVVWINVTLATFNALPMGPLDGGQMFRATLRERLMTKYRVDRAQVHVEKSEMGGMRLSGRDPETQAKLDKIQGVVKRTTHTLGYGILGLILVPILVPWVLRVFYPG